MERTAFFNQLCRHFPIGRWAVGQESYPVPCSSNLAVPEKHRRSSSNEDFDLGGGPETAFLTSLQGMLMLLVQSAGVAPPGFSPEERLGTAGQTEVPVALGKVHEDVRMSSLTLWHF